VSEDLFAFELEQARRERAEAVLAWCESQGMPADLYRDLSVELGIATGAGIPRMPYVPLAKVTSDAPF